MDNIKMLTLIPCTVKGLDRRNGAMFEDLYILSDLDIDLNHYPRTTKDGKRNFEESAKELLSDKYDNWGFQVKEILFEASVNAQVNLLELVGEDNA
ncbi:MULTISPECIES: hypothetical protein [Caproicibacterium]|uniref:Uncharacterized protein n=1 Tax=Caproicibacterium argilliputei TaxID=3030016 RepID=A0AA97DAP8_9FIRM|nr:hypothetical protein [Caproicibacterium argilliputei]WOC33431.1 hypothetical protein PXC00_06085 [Caproicibacterium argilliputei]